LYNRLSKSDKSKEAAKKAFTIRGRNFHEVSSSLAEKDALKFSAFMRLERDVYISSLLNYSGKHTGDQTEIADVILSTKGTVSDGIFERNRALISETDSTSLSLAETYRLARYQKSNLYVQGFKDDIGTYRITIDSLTRLIADLEVDLARHSSSFRRKQSHRNISAGRIQSLLPGNSILVEYLQYDRLVSGSDTAVSHYLALIISSDEAPAVVNLGQASNIDDLVSKYREHLIGLSTSRHAPLLKDKDDYIEVAIGLHDLILRPIGEFLTGRDIIFFAPDGGLNLISFAGLIDEGGTYLIEKFPIQYLSCGRELIRLEDAGGVGKGMLAIGDPDYDADIDARKHYLTGPDYSAPESEHNARPSLRSNCAINTRDKLARLPGTKKEIELISDIWHRQGAEPVATYLGPYASEDALKTEAQGKRIVHLATHGYYLTERCQSEAESGQIISSKLIGENPLLHSGLLLAGANLRGEGADSAGIEDGILTAYEVSAMNLQGIEMVVLSACETGLGEVRQGEGVYGLRRAFQIAGVRTIVSALWPISDKDTAPLISGLYTFEDDILPNRLRRTQLERIDYLRSMELADHPYSWGAFIALGDWR
jgi:CHAT domain-containing protein